MQGLQFRCKRRFHYRMCIPVENCSQFATACSPDGNEKIGVDFLSSLRYAWVDRSREPVHVKHVCMLCMDLSKRWILVIILTSSIIHGFQSLNGIFDPGYKGCGLNNFSTDCFDVWITAIPEHVYVLTQHRYTRDFQSVLWGVKSWANYSSLSLVNICKILFHVIMSSWAIPRVSVCLCEITSAPQNKLHFRCHLQAKTRA